MPAHKKELPLKEIIAQYNSDASVTVQTLADAHGVHSHTLRKRMQLAGCTIRPYYPNRVVLPGTKPTSIHKRPAAASAAPVAKKGKEPVKVAKAKVNPAKAKTAPIKKPVAKANPALIKKVKAKVPAAKAASSRGMIKRR